MPSVMKHKGKLAWKITFWYMLLLLLTVFMLSALTYWGNRQALMQEKLQFLESSVTRVLNVLNDKSEGQSMDLGDPELFTASLSKGVTIQISLPSGKVLRSSSGTVLPIANNIMPEIRTLHGEDTYYLARPIISQGKIQGYLQAAIDLNDVELAQRTLLGQLFWLGGSALLLAAIGGLFLARQVLSPLEKMNQAMTELTARDLHRRLPLRGNGDELDRLGENFNRMLERLEQSFDQQKQFVADASHELRSPLMVIQGHADILKRWGADDPNIVRDSAQTMGDEVQMMTRLVENLLTLAREELVLTITPLNLSDLILESTTGLPYLQHHHIEYDIVPNVMVVGDVLYLRQVLRILMENAGKYVSPGGRIKVSLVVQTQEKKAVIMVEDDGPGIPPEALDSIFKRFYRVDKARSRQVPGHGLGLSIAKRIVEKHEGEIWANNVNPHGAKFTIELPLVKG